MAVSRNRYYGKSAYFIDSFNEVEITADNNATEPEISEVMIASYRRKKTTGKRDSDLEGLPARIIEHRLSEEELKKISKRL